MLSLDSVKRLMSASGSSSAGNEIASAINNGSAVAAASGLCIPAAIVAAHVSETTDFGALQVGDLVVHVPATAGNAAFVTVAAAGTLPVAAVVGDLYVVLRAFSAPAASNVQL